MERKNMTPREFALWWNENYLFHIEEYEKAQSETEKRRLLEECGVPEMYEEAERQLWLTKILEEYGPEDGEPAAMTMEELDKQVHQFALYLTNFELRDYEREFLITSYVHDRGMVALLEDLMEILPPQKRKKIPEDVKEGLRKLGVLEKIGVTS